MVILRRPMSKELPLTEVKSNLPKIVKGVELREDEVVVTRNGRPAAVLLNYAEFCRLKETVEVLTDRQMMAQIRKSRSFYKRGKKGLAFADVFEEPLKKN